MTPTQMTSGTQFNIVRRDRSSQNLPGHVLEDAALNDLDMGKTISVASPYQTSLLIEVAPYETIKEWLGRCRTQFAREMAYGLVRSAIHSYDNGDLDGLGQAVVDWTSTLELEADRKVVRRMRRRGRRNQLGSRTTVHD